MGRISNMINAYRAQNYWIRAHGQMRTDAIYSINRAIKLEPNQSKIPEYLELKGFIEKDISRVSESRATFEKALQFIDEHPQVCVGAKYEELKKRLEVELEDMSFSA